LQQLLNFSAALHTSATKLGNRRVWAGHRHVWAGHMLISLQQYSYGLGYGTVWMDYG